MEYTQSKTPIDNEQLRQLDSIAHVLDSQFSIGGFRFGVDGLIGLVPGLGDVAGGMISLFVVMRARQLGVSDKAANRMLLYVMIDVIIGSIPVIGDLFDFIFKVNERNLRLARKDLARG